MRHAFVEQRGDHPMTGILAALTLTAIVMQGKPANPQAVAQNDFAKRLESYLALRQDLGKKLEPMKSTSSASDLQARQQALAAALRTARVNAKQGDLVTPVIQKQIREAVIADFARRTPAAKKAVFEEVPEGPLPGINKNYPDRAALPTVPPLLLAKLPRLPDNLQYRFFGRHMVILDGDVEIVVDYIPNVFQR
jgi:hypothetical protein